MKYPTFIQKSLSWLIVLSIVAVHACTLSCSIGIYSCSSEMKVAKAGDARSCCSGKNSGDKKGNNCQEEHLTFFHAFGQSSVTKVVKDDKIFPTVIAALTQQVLLPGTHQTRTSLTYNSFHPPPADGDILLFISSFLI